MEIENVPLKFVLVHTGCVTYRVTQMSLNVCQLGVHTQRSNKWKFFHFSHHVMRHAPVSMRGDVTLCVTTA